MADKKLNDLTAASDGAYVYAEDASGNQIKISKADLASVVAGIIGEGYSNRQKFTDANECTNFGYYHHETTATNVPTPSVTYSTLIVLTTAWSIVQLYIPRTSAQLYARVKNNINTWSEWKQLI